MRAQARLKKNLTRKLTRLAERVKRLRDECRVRMAPGIKYIRDYRARIESSRVEKNRFLLLLISLLLILDYALFCYHADKGLFDIFPPFPALDKREERTVYLPYTDGRSILAEKRKVLVSKDREEYVRRLFKIVVGGSIYENTSMAVPIDPCVRAVWFQGQTCIIDVSPATIQENSPLIAGSEANFTRALEKTISANIPSIKKLMLLEKGIPGKQLWEVSPAKSE